jgi:hypothetical protein
LIASAREVAVDLTAMPCRIWLLDYSAELLDQSTTAKVNETRPAITKRPDHALQIVCIQHLLAPFAALLRAKQALLTRVVVAREPTLRSSGHGIRKTPPPGQKRPISSGKTSPFEPAVQDVICALRKAGLLQALRHLLCGPQVEVRHFIFILPALFLGSPLPRLIERCHSLEAFVLHLKEILIHGLIS